MIQKAINLSVKTVWLLLLAAFLLLQAINHLSLSERLWVGFAFGLMGSNIVAYLCNKPMFFHGNIDQDNNQIRRFITFCLCIVLLYKLVSLALLHKLPI